MSPTPADGNQTQEARDNVLKDLAAGFFALICAGLLAIQHFRQNGRLHQDFGAEPGPALLPELLMMLLAANGALLLARAGWRHVSTRNTAPTVTAGVWASWRSGAAYAALLTFAQVQDIFGFGLAVCLLGGGLALLCANSSAYNKGRAIISGALLSMLIYAVFRYGLSVPLT